MKEAKCEKESFEVRRMLRCVELPVINAGVESLQVCLEPFRGLIRHFHSVL